MTDQDAGRADGYSIRSKRAAMIVATLALLALAALAAEGAVRLRQYMKYGATTAYEDYYTVDRRIGLRVPVANLSKGHISINSLGFRGPEIPMPKPENTVRIAFLGASTTWCAEVSGNEQVWPHLVTQALSRAFPTVRFDYVNAGVPGYTVSSILKNFTYRVAPLQPDVVVFYEGSNNLSGEMRDLAAAQGIIADSKVPEVSWPGRHSMLWYLVEKNLRVWSAARAAEHNPKQLDVRIDTLGSEYGNGLRQILDAAKRTAKLVVVVTFSVQPRPDQTPDQQVHAALSAHFYMPFLSTRTLMEAYARYNTIAREIAQESGAMLIGGEDRIPGDPAHFSDSVHFTDAGSRAMAARVSDALIHSARFRDSLMPSLKQP